MPAPPLAKGDDPKAKLAQTRNALKVCNAKNGNALGWYDGVRQSYRVKR